MKLNILKTPENRTLDITYTNTIKDYSQIGISIFIYPYSRKVTSNDFEFLPYEEYVADISNERSSVYYPIIESYSKLFGLFLSITIFIVFAFINIDLVSSVEAIISIIGAYAIGKEFWKDIEKWLVTRTQTFRISLRPQVYDYQREDFGTIQKYIQFGRKSRYKFDSIIPSKLSLVNQSNSELVDMLFTKKDLAGIQQARILTIKFKDSKLFEEVEKNNFMFGAKIMVSKKVLFFKVNTEYFQAINKNIVGVLQNGKWIEGKTLVKKTLSFGKIKFYITEKFIEGTEIF